MHHKSRRSSSLFITTGAFKAIKKIGLLGAVADFHAFVEDLRVCPNSSARFQAAAMPAVMLW